MGCVLPSNTKISGISLSVLYVLKKPFSIRTSKNSRPLEVFALSQSKTIVANDSFVKTPIFMELNR